MSRQLIYRSILLPIASFHAIACLTWVLNSSIAFAESPQASSQGAVTDFVDYWAASRLLLNGKNPFSYDDVLELQRSVGYAETHPMLLWYPPWTLSFILPFGAMEYQLSHFTWLMMNVFLLLLSGQKLWEIYAPGTQKSYLPWLAIFTFAPTWMVLIMGNITRLILLGIVGFLYFEKRNQLFLAGVATSIVSVKAHLIYLFWVGLILWIWKHRHWRVAFGAITAVLVAGAIPLILDPSVYSEFIHMYRFPRRTTPFDLPAPSVGSLLTLYVPHGTVPIQFLPALLGTAWFIWHWTRHKNHWNWPDQIPMILLVSLSMSAYAWTYDLVMLLPAVIQALVMVREKMDQWYKNSFVLLYWGGNLAYFVLKLFVTTDIYYFWLAPALFLTYLGIAGRLTLATGACAQK